LGGIGDLFGDLRHVLDDFGRMPFWWRFLRGLGGTAQAAGGFRQALGHVFEPARNLLAVGVGTLPHRCQLLSGVASAIAPEVGDAPVRALAEEIVGLTAFCEKALVSGAPVHASAIRVRW